MHVKAESDSRKLKMAPAGLSPTLPIKVFGLEPQILRPSKKVPLENNALFSTAPTGVIQRIGRLFSTTQPFGL